MVEVLSKPASNNLEKRTLLRSCAASVALPSVVSSYLATGILNKYHLFLEVCPFWNLADTSFISTILFLPTTKSEGNKLILYWL